MYDATLGRFLQRDPLGPAVVDGGLYAYAGDRPADVLDPLGLQGGDAAAKEKPKPKDKRLIKPEGAIPEKVKKQLQERIEKEFENVKSGEYEITDWHGFYQNCIGLTCGVQEWLWPSFLIPGTDLEASWPGRLTLPRPETFDKLYADKGYKKAEKPGLEGCKPECDKIKIALYALGQDVTHAAIEDCQGKWDSKLGDGPRIKHAKLEQLEGKKYGKVLYCYEKEQKGCNKALCPKEEEGKGPC
jgi:hypothetical protein